MSGGGAPTLKLVRDRWLWLVLAVALAVRLGTIVVASGYEPVADAFDYARHASSIAASEGYPETAIAGVGPTAFRPPGYPYLLGAVFALSGDSLTAGLVANALLGVTAVLLAFLVASSMFGRRIALAAAAICAVFPPLVFQSTSLMSEPLFVVLALTAVLCALRLQAASRMWPWALALGLVCGAAALTRSNGTLLLAPAVLAVVTAHGQPRRARLGAITAVVAAAALTVAPWTVRNTLAFDEPVLLSTQGGYGIAGVYNPAARGDDTFPAMWLAPQFEGPFVDLFRRPDLSELEVDRELREAAFDFAKQNPSYPLVVSLHSVLRLADVIASQRQVSVRSGGSTLGDRAERFARYATWLLLLGAMGGLAILWRGGRLPWDQAFVWLVPVVVVLPAIPVLGGPRYRAPADPFLAILAAVALVALLARLHRAPARGATTAAAGSRMASAQRRPG